VGWTGGRGLGVRGRELGPGVLGQGAEGRKAGKPNHEEQTLHRWLAHTGIQDQLGAREQ